MHPLTPLDLWALAIVAVAACWWIWCIERNNWRK